MNDFVKKMLDYNRAFVEHGLYEKYTTTKYPDRKIAILACMDTRMTELLPAALGLKNGDVKLIKNAGGRVMHPYGSVIFSLLVAVYELGVDTVVVIGHDDCGGRLLDPKEMIAKMKERGISQEAIDHVDENHKNVYQSFCAKHRRCHSGASAAAKGSGGARLHHGPPYGRSPRRFREKGIKKIKYEKSLFV